MNRKAKLSIVLMALLLLAGCATTSTTQPPQVIPAGCEQSIVYTKMPGFMPNGPMIARVSISTALAVATTAGHPEFKLLVAAVMPILYRAALTNTLGGVLPQVQDKFKTPQFVNYATPFVVLFDSLTQAGVVKVGLTECDKNVLASLFKNIGLDSGADPELFN
jgi:hypothetical protein